MKLKKLLPIFLLLVIVLLGYFYLINYAENKISNNKVEFKCSEYFLPKSTKWEQAYDDVKFCNEPLILLNKKKEWGILYPGSITLHGKEIHINQELGYPNSCYFIGRLKKNETFDLPNGDRIKAVNDSTLLLNTVEFNKITISVISGGRCDWKDTNSLPTRRFYL